MRYILPVVCAFLTSVLLFTSCEPKVVNLDLDFGYEYYPAKVGDWFIYEADSTVWDSFKKTTYTVNFQIREEVKKEFLNSEGKTSYTIERSYRNGNSGSWNKRDTWSAVVTDLVVERVEENARFLNLSFPLLLGKSWKGNAYLNETTDVLKPAKDWDWDYTVKSIQDENVLNTTTQVIEIEQVNDTESLIQRAVSTEKYAKGFGLIYKEMILLDSKDIVTAWPDDTDDGYIYHQRLIERN